MKVVIAGASGFVGRHLVPLLAEDEVLCGTRNVARAQSAAPDQTWVHLDVGDTDSLKRALDGADALVFLVHLMRSDGDLLAKEEASARRVLDAAESVGLKRLVYLGGPRPTDGVPSKHLRARLLTGEVLRSGSVSTIELRAGMVIGSGSESWLIVRDLALRLPVMILPSWLKNRSQPIFIHDVVRALAYCVHLDTDGSHAWDLPGPETLSAREILTRIAAQVGIRPLMVPVPVLTPGLSSHWIRLVTRADFDVARKLVGGLTNDLVAPDDGFWSVAPELKRTPLDEAVRQALAEDDQGLTRAGRAWEAAARWVALPAR